LCRVVRTRISLQAPPCSPRCTRVGRGGERRGEIWLPPDAGCWSLWRATSSISHRTSHSGRPPHPPLLSFPFALQSSGHDAKHFDFASCCTRHIPPTHPSICAPRTINWFGSVLRISACTLLATNVSLTTHRFPGSHVIAVHTHRYALRNAHPSSSFVLFGARFHLRTSLSVRTRSLANPLASHKRRPLQTSSTKRLLWASSLSSAMASPTQ
jgi:hypothetical protein